MTTPSAFTGIDIPTSDLITQCMHCGMCLPACPTYALTLQEKASPRGRIRLIKAVAEGELEITPGFVDAMHFCLDCRACETACPAGVQYGKLVEAARAQIETHAPGPLWSRLLKSFFLRFVFIRPERLLFLGRIMAFVQALGLDTLPLPGRLGKLQKFSPRIARRQTLPAVIPGKTAQRGRVALLTGCVMDLIYPDINADTAHVLAHNGYEVHTIPHQVCCGSLHGHTGDRDTARVLAKKNIDAFHAETYDAIIVNSAGCGSFMKHYDHLLDQDADYRERARTFSRKCKDVTEFLAEKGFEKPTRPLRRRVTYHEACHLVHGQGVSQQPREILKSIPGLELVELTEATWCCGSAGIYNVTRTEDSLKLLERKMNHIEATAADTVVTGNPGCLLQIQTGARGRGLPMRVVHPVTLLRMAYEG